MRDPLPAQKPLTVGSLFAGIGGFDLGFQRAGFEIRWQVEIDPFALTVLEQHFPEAERFSDVRIVHGVMAHTAGICEGQAREQHAGKVSR